MITLRLISRDILGVEAEVALVTMLQGELTLRGEAARVDSALGGALREALVGGKIRGALGETALFESKGKLGAGSVMAVGLGPRETLTPDEMKDRAHAIMDAAEKLGARTLAMSLPGRDIPELLYPRAAGPALEGLLLGLSEAPGDRLLILLEDDGDDYKMLRRLAAQRVSRWDGPPGLTLDLIR